MSLIGLRAQREGGSRGGPNVHSSFDPSAFGCVQSFLPPSAGRTSLPPPPPPAKDYPSVSPLLWLPARPPSRPTASGAPTLIEVAGGNVSGTGRGRRDQMSLLPSEELVLSA